MSRFFSPKEVALALGVSESSLKRWVDRGYIRATKTAGGHRRLQLDAVLSYIRSQGRDLEDPVALGLPAECGRRVSTVDQSRMEFRQAILNGDEGTSRRVMLDSFLAGESVAGMFDDVITPVFHEVGNLWQCGEVEIYKERRACEICARVIHSLRDAIGDGPEDGPSALGGTLDGDPYTLATSMVELVLRHAGWRAQSLGNMLPFHTLQEALVQQRPRLLWLSISSIRDPDRFTSSFNMLYDAAQASGAALVVGGRALTAEIRQRIRFTTHCDTFRHVETFADAIRPRE